MLMPNWLSCAGSLTSHGKPGFDLLMENALDSSMPLPLSSDSHLHLLKVRAVQIQQSSCSKSPSHDCMLDGWETS